MTMVCHQQYSELKKIPTEFATRMMATAGRWVNMLKSSDTNISSDTNSQNTVKPNLPPIGE